MERAPTVAKNQSLGLDRMVMTMKSSAPQRRSYKNPSLEEALRKGKIEVVDMVDDEPQGDLAKLRRLHANHSSETRVKPLPKKEPKYSYSSTNIERPYSSFTAINSPGKEHGSQETVPYPKKPERIVDWGIDPAPMGVKKRTLIPEIEGSSPEGYSGGRQATEGIYVFFTGMGISDEREALIAGSESSTSAARALKKARMESSELRGGKCSTPPKRRCLQGWK